jgi:hypothetical protein
MPLTLGADLEQIATAIMDAAFQIHVALGAALLEEVYETLLTDGLRRRGFTGERQRRISFKYAGSSSTKASAWTRWWRDASSSKWNQLSVRTQRLMYLTLGSSSTSVVSFQGHVKRVVNELK